jgi:hypothetical protein
VGFDWLYIDVEHSRIVLVAMVVGVVVVICWVRLVALCCVRNLLVGGSGICDLLIEVEGTILLPGKELSELFCV